MVRLELVKKCGTEQLSFDAKCVACGGWTGRDRALVMKHVEELAKLGIPPPKKVPLLFPVSRYLLTQDEEIEILAQESSGEIEYVILIGSDAMYVTVGSDHTDRELERFSIEKAKQACPKIIARQGWLYGDVRDHWDEIILRSHVTKEGKRTLYQEARLDNIIDVDKLLALEDGKYRRNGAVFFSGTISTHGGLVFADRFEMEMVDLKLSRRIGHRYDVNVLTQTGLVN